ncbi:MAG: 6-phosphogluconolactonase [Vicinamibacterales bacterium]
MRVETAETVEATAARAAAWIADRAGEAVAARGQFTLAVSGGSTPWLMLRVLAGLALPWSVVHVFQVDERVAPAGDVDRNWTQLHGVFDRLSPPPHLHPMPVESEDGARACDEYRGRLEAVAGRPPVVDVVHLGLGADGHTASLVPGDPLLEQEADTAPAVAMSIVYQGRPRMTLTLPVINRARHVLWVVTGESKRTMLSRLRGGDRAIPAGRVRGERATVFADRAAAGV